MKSLQNKSEGVHEELANMKKSVESAEVQNGVNPPVRLVAMK